jgi:uracil-DNA glycosylase
MHDKAEEDKRFFRVVVVCLVVFAGGFALFAPRQYPGDPRWLVGTAVILLTPAGWIPAALVAWLFDKLFPAEGAPTDSLGTAKTGHSASNTSKPRFGTYPAERWSATGLASPTVEAMKRYAYAVGAIYPPKERVFRAYWLTSPGEVRVVIIGSDPYPTPGDADGLAFSAKRATSLPPTLSAIFDELQQDIGGPRRERGNLSDWSRQGVLLLNASLTVEPSVDEEDNRSNAIRHARTWHPLIEATIGAVSSTRSPVVFVLLGRPAQSFLPYIGPGNHVVSAAHPSPRAATSETELARFAGSRVFSRINTLLAQSGRPIIDWSG